MVYKMIKYNHKICINEPLLISGIINARSPISFKASELKKSEIGLEYSYSFWIYPSGWDYKFGKPKHVLSRGSNPNEIHKEMLFNPGIWFYPQTSNLSIRFDTYGSGRNYIKKNNTKLNSSDKSTIKKDSNIEECKDICNENDDCKGFTFNKTNDDCILSEKATIENKNISTSDGYIKTHSMNPYQLDNSNYNPINDCDLIEIPLQRWSHIVVSLWNRTTDIYLNGKLVRSCILPNVAKIPHDKPLNVCADGGYDGKFGQLRYFNRSLGPNEVYKLYQRGPLSWNLFSTYEDSFPKINGSKK